jgi:cell division protein FtsB
MRDIGDRIRKYRLIRYAGPDVRLRRRLRWVGAGLAAWLLWAGVLSDHSFFRLWRLSHELAQQQAQLERLHREAAAREAELHDPQALRELGEHMLREKGGMVRPGEIVYRVQPADSLPKR